MAAKGLAAVMADDAVGDAIPEGITQADRLAVDAAIDRMDVEEWRATQLRDPFRAHATATIDATVATVNTRALVDIRVNLPDPVARRIVAEGGTRAGLVDVLPDTRQAMYRAIADGRTLGEGPSQLSLRVRDYVSRGRFTNAGIEYRSMLIARTETKHAQNLSSIKAYETSEAVTGVIAFDDQLTARRRRVFKPGWSAVHAGGR